VEAARINAKVGQSPNEWIGDDLENERTEWLVGIGMPHHPLPGDRMLTFYGGHIQRRRKIVHNGVQNRLYTSIAQRRPTQYGDELAGQRCLAQRDPQFFGTQVLPF